MSHTHYPSIKTRLQRSELAVPAVSPPMIDKAAQSGLPIITAETLAESAQKIVTAWKTVA